MFAAQAGSAGAEAATVKESVVFRWGFYQAQEAVLVFHDEEFGEAGWGPGGEKQRSWLDDDGLIAKEFDEQLLAVVEGFGIGFKAAGGNFSQG